MPKTKRLPPRTIVVGCDEQSETVLVTDQKTLLELQEIENYLPAPKQRISGGPPRPKRQIDAKANR